MGDIWVSFVNILEEIDRAVPGVHYIDLGFLSCPPGWLPMMLVHLSVFSNAAKLLSTKRSQSSLDAIHGIRFFSMTWVILGHTYVFAMYNNIGTCG